MVIMLDVESECSKFKFERVVHAREYEARDSKMSVKFQGSPLSIDAEVKELSVFGVPELFMIKLVKNSAPDAFSVSFKLDKDVGEI